MTNKTYWLASSEGKRLFYQSWLTAKTPKANICIVHGFAEHSNRYQQMAEVFNADGFNVYAFDRIGHGQSEGKRAHTSSYERFLEELDLEIDLALKESPDLPVFLYGHSQGGNITLNYVLKRKPDIAGAIVTASWIYLGDSPSPFMQGILKILVNILPSLSVPTNLDPEDISKDSDEVKKYREDPAVFSKITLRTAFEMFNASEYLKKKHSSSIPLLVMHGGDDKICLTKGSTEFVSNFDGDIEYKEWPGRFHEIHNDYKREEVFKFSLNWMNQKL